MASFFPRLKKIKVPDDPFESAFFYSFDRPAAIQRIGDSIMSRVSEATKQPRATANIQRLLVNDQRVRIKSWVSQLPKLKTLEVGDATSLTPDLAKSIVDNCPNFCNLTVSSLAKARQDAELGLFLYALKENTLQRLIVSAHFVAAETLQSLNHHAESLTSIKIFGLLSVGAKKLGLLLPCKALVTVELSFSVPGSIPTMPGLVRIKNDQQDAIIDWLCGCRNLRDLAVENLSKGSTVLSRVCSKDWIRLQKLKLLGFRFDKSLEFFRALSSQADLEHLFLGGDPECCRPSHCEIFMGCLASLTNLKYLRLTPDYISGCYSMYKTMDIISYIPRVEELTIACRSANDILWLALSTLCYLRVFRIYGVAEFTLKGILEYINNLQPTNHGLSLLIIGQNRAKPITMAQQELISRNLHAKVGGYLEVENL
ncbi:hypothetical protein K3495_g5046 [Podosphaera aphanis]|nr:hypothetical protein K3495_g5046 [Podosphaera aphanis]